MSSAAHQVQVEATRTEGRHARLRRRIANLVGDWGLERSSRCQAARPFWCQPMGSIKRSAAAGPIAGRMIRTFPDVRRRRDAAEDNNMANKNRTVYAIGGRYEFQGHDYGVSVYRVDNEYYASWRCEYCLTRGETDLVPERRPCDRGGASSRRGSYVKSHAAGSLIAVDAQLAPPIGVGPDSLLRRLPMARSLRSHEASRACCKAQDEEMRSPLSDKLGIFVIPHGFESKCAKNQSTAAQRKTSEGSLAVCSSIIFAT